MWRSLVRAKSAADRQSARRAKLRREGAKQILVTLPRPAYDRLRELQQGRTVSETIADLIATPSTVR
jgi:hypothetical protein